MRVTTNYHIDAEDCFSTMKYPRTERTNSFVSLRCNAFAMFFDMDHSEVLDSLIEAAKEVREKLKELENEEEYA